MSEKGNAVPIMEEIPPLTRPSMKSLFTSGVLVSSNKNSKQALMFKSLQWRQAYQNLDYYRYEFEPTSLTTASEDTFTIEMKQILNGEMKGFGTGTFVWPAAHIMCKYLEKAYGRAKLTGLHVCDVGTGTGITGFIAAFLGSDVKLTDQACVLELLQENTNQFILSVRNRFPEASSLLGILQILEYDWVAKNTLSERPFDLLLISDCVLPKLYPIDLLVSAVEHLMSENTVALFSYEHRPYAQFDPRQEFERLCELHGLVVSVVPLSEHHPIYRAEDIELWEVRRKKSPTFRVACSSASELHGRYEIVDDGRAKLVMHNWGEDKECIDATLVTYPVNRSDAKQNILPLHLWQSSAAGASVGSILWPSSVLCSRLLLSGQYFQLQQNNIGDNNPEKVSWCLDIGAGCGLTSIVAHQLGYNILATDRSSLVDGLLHRNIEDYFSTLSCQSSPSVVGRGSLTHRSLDWEATTVTPWQEQLQLTTEQHIRYVICSDCLYSSPAVPPLLSLLDSIALRERQVSMEATNQENTNKSVSVQVLLVNELRSALEEFLYFALHRPDPSISVKITEIPVSAPELVLVRSAEAFHVAPPLRACLLTWTCSW